MPQLTPKNVISTEDAQLHRAAEWRDPCIYPLFLLLSVFSTTCPGSFWTVPKENID
jgi:hypothetical protein